jgi:LysR family glycine cleavage system transcriptional activator
MLSPGLASRGRRLTVRRLLQIPLIPDPRWREWFALAGLPEARAQFVSTRFPNYELEAQAAIRGLGAALLSPLLFAELVSQRALVAPFPWVVEGPSSYWLLATSDASGCHFVRWIKSQFAVQPAGRMEAGAVAVQGRRRR